MLILQVGLKSCVWPRRKRWYRSFCRTRLLLARRAQNVAKNRATCWRTGGKVLCSRTGGSTATVLFSPPARPSTRYFYSCARPPTHYFPPVLQHVALFLATFWPLLPSWSRVRPNDLYHRFRLGKTQLLRPTCIIATGSL